MKKSWEEIVERVWQLDREQQALTDELMALQDACPHEKLPKRDPVKDAPYCDICGDCGIATYSYPFS